MHFSYRRSYTGPLKAAMLDWSGTVIDYGSRSPLATFVEIFRRRGVAVSEAEVRGPMGTAKADHIRALLALEPVQAQWRARHGRPSNEGDVQALFDDFEPAELAHVADYARLIPGARETIAALRARDMKIGTSTGYSHRLMERILPLVREQGYVPDSVVCPEDVPAGRPLPWMLFQNAIALEVYPLAACVKVGDTHSDIAEGLNAGMWTVGLARSGNELGLDEEATRALDASELAARLDAVRQAMRQAGAHYVIDTIADLPPVLDAIEARLARGEQP